MKNSIAYVAGIFPSRSETFVYREVRALRLRGWTVRCVSLNPPPDDGDIQFHDLEAGLLLVYSSRSWRNAFAEIARHPLRSLRTLSTSLRDMVAPGEKTDLKTRLKLPAQAMFALGVARQLRRDRVEHIHCHFAHAPTTIGMYAAKQLGVPFSFTGHANDIFQRRALLSRKIQRAKFVSCISRWHAEFYQSLAPAARPKLKLIRCGVDVKAWEAKKNRRASAVRLRVLTVCRLVEKKGVDTLIRALCEMKDRRWELTIAGDGPDRQRLEDLAEHCASKIRWLGAVDNDRIPRLLSSAEVFALPCRRDSNGDRDGIPVVLMEAMACRVPVIAGDLPAIRELVSDGASGFLIAGEDVQMLMHRLRALADDVAMRKELSEAGRKRVEEEFSLDMNVSRLEDALRGI